MSASATAKSPSLTSKSDDISAAETIDAAGKLLLPGAIDIHFHCRAPAYPQRGDFATETRAAAAGGVTTVFEMPISKPCCATGEIFRMRRALAERDAYVNFGLYGAPGLLDRAVIADMVGRRRDRLQNLHDRRAQRPRRRI